MPWETRNSNGKRCVAQLPGELSATTKDGCPRCLAFGHLGKHEPQSIRRVSRQLQSRAFFWRGPAAGGWPNRGWCLAGCPLIQPFPPFSKPQLMGALRAASSREGWESTNLNPSGVGVPPTSIPRLFSGADRPQAIGPTAGGVWRDAHSSNHFPPFPSHNLWVSFAQLHRAKGGKARTSTHPAQVSRQLQSRAFFWRGPAAGGWPHRRWFAENYLHLAHNGNGGGDSAGLENPQKTSTPPPPLCIFTTFSVLRTY